MDNQNYKNSKVEQANLIQEKYLKYIDDPMDMPGTLKKAREHGSAQRIFKIPNDIPEGKLI